MTKTHATCHDPANSAVPESAESSRSAEESSALAARLSTLIGRQSVSAFGRKCGIAESVLRSYLYDRRMPPLDKALAIATAAGVSLDWLAAGQSVPTAGEKRAADPTASTDAVPVPVVDADLLEGILKALLENEGARLAPRQLAALAVERYRRARATDSQE